VRTLCFGDAHEPKCNAEQASGRAAALPVDDQRGKARGGVGGVHAHEVSILIVTRGVVGRWRGWQPASKVSMMIMRPTAAAAWTGQHAWFVGSCGLGCLGLFRPGRHGRQQSPGSRCDCHNSILQLTSPDRCDRNRSKLEEAAGRNRRRAHLSVVAPSRRCSELRHSTNCIIQRNLITKHTIIML
jgi:hypothetical protein